jgi:hypothetical protein
MKPETYMKQIKNIERWLIREQREFRGIIRKVGVEHWNYGWFMNKLYLISGLLEDLSRIRHEKQPDMIEQLKKLRRKAIREYNNDPFWW